MIDVLTDLLSDVSHRFQQKLQTGVQQADLGLTPFEAKALVTIARMPGSTQQAMIARIGCDKAQMARAVKVLEARSMITREPSATDWRASDLALTTSGQSVFEELQACRKAIAEQCFAGLGVEEREALGRFLTLMSSNIGD